MISIKIQFPVQQYIMQMINVYFSLYFDNDGDSDLTSGGPNDHEVDTRSTKEPTVSIILTQTLQRSTKSSCSWF